MNYDLVAINLSSIIDLGYKNASSFQKNYVYIF